MDRVLDPALDVGDGTLSVAFVPVPVQRLGGDAELNDEVVAHIVRLGLAALLLPQPDERRLVRAHDDPGVRSADELASASAIFLWFQQVHSFLQRSNHCLLLRYDCPIWNETYHTA
jgi:hypothetical protein